MGKAISKSDKEPSIVASTSAIAAARAGETVPSESPVRASESNGMMENAVNSLQVQWRTTTHYVESRIGKSIEPASVVCTLLVPCCADIPSKFRVGGDGRTAYARTRSHACKGAQIGFAELLDFKLETDKSDASKADSRFSEGVLSG